MCRNKLQKKPPQRWVKRIHKTDEYDMNEQSVGNNVISALIDILKNKIGYSLMVNHDSIESAIKIFEKSSEAQKEFKLLFRKCAFETAIKHNVDMIFTLVVAYDLPEEVEYINNLKTMFEATGGKLYFVELKADLETRLERNVTPHRLEAKPSKKDLEWSRNDLLNTMEKYKLNTDEGEYLFENHLKIDNTNLSPDEVVEIIMEKFELNR